MWLVTPSSLSQWLKLLQIRFLGGKLGEHLSTEFEVQTVGELEHITLGNSIGERTFCVDLRPSDHFL